MPTPKLYIEEPVTDYVKDFNPPPAGRAIVLTAECRGFESHQPRAALLSSLEKYLPPSSQTHVGQREVAHGGDEVTVVSKPPELKDLDSGIPNSQQVDD